MSGNNEGIDFTGYTNFGRPEPKDSVNVPMRTCVNCGQNGNWIVTISEYEIATMVCGKCGTLQSGSWDWKTHSITGKE